MVLMLLPTGSCPPGSFLTARTAERLHPLADDALKDWFQDTLCKLIDEAGWKLEAWCILSNHYHLVARSPKEGGNSLGSVVQHLHSLTTKELNHRDRTVGRTRLSAWVKTITSFRHDRIAELDDDG